MVCFKHFIISDKKEIKIPQQFDKDNWKLAQPARHSS